MRAPGTLASVNVASMSNGPPTGLRASSSSGTSADVNCPALAGRSRVCVHTACPSGSRAVRLSLPRGSSTPRPLPMETTITVLSVREPSSLFEPSSSESRPFSGDCVCTDRSSSHTCRGSPACCSLATVVRTVTARIFTGASMSVVEPLLPVACSPAPRTGTVNRRQPSKSSVQTFASEKLAFRCQAGSEKLMWSSNKITSSSAVLLPLTQMESAVGLPGSTCCDQTWAGLPLS